MTGVYRAPKLNCRKLPANRTANLQPDGTLGSAIDRLKGTEELLLVSFTCTHGLVADKKRYVDKKAGQYQWDDPLSKFSPQRKGQIILFDFNSGRILWRFMSPLSAGFTIDQNGLHIASYTKIFTIKGENIHVRTHPWFNDLHSVETTPDGQLIVTNSGTDNIMIFSPQNNKTSYVWWATDHGYPNQADNGTPIRLDRSSDLRKYLPSTGEEATHINSARIHTDGSILATLFHQNALIQIDSSTGIPTILLGGLNRPHSIYPSSFGHTMCDTNNNQALLLDPKFGVIKTFRGDYSWLQDARLSADEKWLYLLDVNNNRVVKVEVDTSTLINHWEYDAEWSGFNVRPIIAEEIQEKVT